ncbi:Transposable element Tc1 transposase-like Protein [Tribolium castaneum]|uniref:Transposable element Tc1 transposase-like Protein n=1 Tax=Tribolium castaneum TaxID=7070 RepID=D7GYF8_TRICA|nr:Transposable element Tc1 transposase-like Protein [Tribolium castaneum]
MDRFMYRDILQDVMLPYVEWEMPLRFIFQQDNDPKHTSALVSEWIQNNNIHVLQWPAQSPDLNPIENLWEEVERRIRIQRFPNKQSLIDKIKEVWSNLDENVIQKLISSMPRRCQKIILNNGYAINY